MNALNAHFYEHTMVKFIRESGLNCFVHNYVKQLSFINIILTAYMNRKTQNMNPMIIKKTAHLTNIINDYYLLIMFLFYQTFFQNRHTVIIN